jgi:hypothetical protein
VQESVVLGVTLLLDNLLDRQARLVRAEQWLFTIHKVFLPNALGELREDKIRVLLADLLLGDELDFTLTLVH